MVTEEDVRQVALSLPGSAERPYNGLPSFRVGGKLFLRIHELPDVFFVRCAGLEERDELLKSEPGKLFITPHYEGYPGILVRLSQVDPGEMTEIVTDAWRACAPKRLLAAYEAGHPPAPAGYKPTSLDTNRGMCARSQDTTACLSIQARSLSCCGRS